MTRVLLAALAALLLLAASTGAAEPMTQLDSAPDAVSGDTTPSFAFSSNEAGSTFECRFAREGDAEPGFSPCTSPYTLTVGDGRYRFEVRATDPAGNVDPSPVAVHFTVDSTAIDTDIEAGPAGLTRNATPSFTFGSETPGATYQCRLEGPRTPLSDWTDCSSPYETPSLANGEWTLHVRAKDQGGNVDPTPATRKFAIDGIAPNTTITAPKPNGNVTSRPVRVTYTGADDAPGALAFECRVDNQVRGGQDTVEFTPCAVAGWDASLDSGKHTIEVRALDVAGNVDPTPASVAVSVSLCERVVRFDLVEAEAECLQADADAPEGTKRWTSKDGLTLNGLPLGTNGIKATLEQKTSGGGKLMLSIGAVSVLGVELFDGQLEWDLPKGGAGDEKLVEEVDLTGGKEELFGMKIKGVARLRLGRSKSDEYYGVAQLTLALPEVFKSGPEPGAGGVTGDVAIKITKAGVKLDGAKIQVTNAYIGRVGVKSVCLSYVAAGGRAIAPCTPPSIGGKSGESFLECGSNPDKDRWDGSAAVVLPTPSNLTLGLWAGVSGSRLAYAGASVENLGEMVPLGPGVFLNRVALGVCLDPPPFQLKGEAAVAFGPTFGDAGPGIIVIGSMHYSDPYKGPRTIELPLLKKSITMNVDLPWFVKARGEIQVFGYSLASGYLSIYGNGLVDFGFRAGFEFGPASIHGSIDGWFIFDGSGRFNVEGEIKACIDKFGCAGVEGVASSKGIGACMDLVLTTVGAGYTWKTRDLDILGSGCKISRWSVPKPIGNGAQVGPVVPGLALDVPKGVDTWAIRVNGKGGAPRVAFVGPDGRRIVAPEHNGGEIDKRSHVLAQVEEQNHTAIVILRPAPGRWRIEPLPGSVEITGLQVARERPDPEIRATVTGPDRNGVRTLRYAAALARDEQVSLVEKGLTSMRTLGSLKPGDRCGALRVTPVGHQRRYCGEIRFRPASGNGGRRGVEAMIERDGTPQPHRELATYKVPPTPLPARPSNVTVRRTAGNRVVIGVTPSAGSAKTSVRVDVQDGRRLSYERRSTRRFAIVIRDVSRRFGVAVNTRGIRKDLRLGQARRVTLHGGEKAVPAPKKTKRASRRTR